MSKANRIVRYFPACYRATRRTSLLYEVVACLAGPLEEADTLLFRIQRAHRLTVAEHAEDIVRLAAALNLTPRHFEDLLADDELAYEEKLARMRDRVWRVGRVHLVGLGTPWAVLEAAAIFLDAAIVPARPGAAPIGHLDPAGYSHVAQVEFTHLPDRPRARLYLHENPPLRRKVEPAARWPLDSWSVDNRHPEATPLTLSIQGVGERTVLPSIFCPGTGEGLLFNGVVPDGQTLLIDPNRGALLGGAPVDGWVVYYTGGIVEFAALGSATAVVEVGREGPPLAGDPAGTASQYQPKRPVPGVPPGASRWHLAVARGVYDGAAFDFAVFDTPPGPIGVYDGDTPFDGCLFDYPPSAVAGMAWDERLSCAFKLLLPAHVPRPPRAESATAAPVAAGQTAESGPSPPGTGRWVPGANDVGRIAGLLARFKAAGVRAYVDVARDAWILGEGVLRGGAATAGAGIEFHATRLRDPRGDLFVDAETA